MRRGVQNFLVGMAVFLAAAPGRSQVNLHVGARPYGMGETFTAIANDGNAVYWNPAGLPLLKRGELSLMTTNLYNTGVRNSYLAFVYPMTNSTAFGFGYNRIDLNDGLQFSHNVLQASFGQQIYSFLWLGANVKFVDTDSRLDDQTGTLTNLFNESAKGLGADAGALVTWPSETIPFLKDLRFGLAVRDIGGTEVKFNSGVKEEILPETYRVGLAWMPDPTKWFGSVVKPTLAFEFNHKDRVHFGGEALVDLTKPSKTEVLRQLGLRFGVQRDLHDSEGLTYSFGMSVNMKYIFFDYAYTVPPSLPSTHRFGVTLPLGPGTFFFKKLKLIDRVKMTVTPQIPRVHPYLIDTYERDGLFTVDLANPRNESLNGTLTISVSAKDSLYDSNSFTLTLPPKQTTVVPFHPVFNRDQIAATQKRQVRYTVKLVYTFAGGLVDSLEFKRHFDQYDKNTIFWNDFRTAAAVVHDRNPTVRKFVHDLLWQAELPEDADNIVKAAWLFEALTVKGFHFHTDGLPAHVRPAPDSTIVFPPDEIQFPSELILSAEKAGDCDDLTALFASLLAHEGIETALIDAPKHIFLMFNSGHSSLNRFFFPIDPDYLVERHGRLWIPLEITDVSKDFMQAWFNGKTLYNELDVSGEPRIVDLSEAWSIYPPIRISSDTVGVGFTSIEIDSIQEKVEKRMSDLENLKRKYIADRYPVPIDSLRDPQVLNERGIISVGLNRADDAYRAFHKARALQPNNPKILNNLGNLHFVSGNHDSTRYYYERALTLNDTTMGLQLNSAQFHYALALSSKAHSDERKEGLRIAQSKMRTVLNNVGEIDKVLALMNIPAEPAVVEPVKGDPDRTKGGFSLSGILSFIGNVFSRNLEKEVTWEIGGGTGLPAGSPATVVFEVQRVPEAGDPLHWPLEASALRMRDGQAESALPGAPTPNLKLTITRALPADNRPFMDKSNFVIKVENTSKAEVLENIRIVYILPPGVEMSYQSPRGRIRTLSNKEYERYLASIGAQRFGVSKGRYLFWYN